MGASQAKLSNVSLFQSFQYNDLLPLNQMIAQYKQLALCANMQDKAAEQKT